MKVIKKKLYTKPVQSYLSTVYHRSKYVRGHVTTLQFECVNRVKCALNHGLVFFCSADRIYVDLM